jgi:hypothetical protein
MTDVDAGKCRFCGQRLYAELDLDALVKDPRASWGVFHHAPRCKPWKEDPQACIPSPAPYASRPEFLAAVRRV